MNTDNNKHEADHRWFRVFTTIGIVIIIILLLLRSCGDAGMGGQDFIARIFDTAAEQSVVDEGVEKLSGDELQNLVDSQVAEGMIRISMNMDPVFASGTAAGNLNITNSETNRYPQIVEIYYGEQCVYFTITDGKTSTVTVTNRAYSGITIHKTDATTSKGIYGVSFLLYDSRNNVVGQYTSDDRGYVRIVELDAGTYRIRELENEGYIVDTQLKTVVVKSGEVTLVEWKNTPITGQIQISKTSADYSAVTGLPAGTALEGAVFEIYDRANMIRFMRS